MPSPTDNTRAARKAARPLLLRALRSAPPGTLKCPKCREPIVVGQPVDVGHARPVVSGGINSGLALWHRSCNRAEGFELARKVAKQNKRNGKSKRRKLTSEHSQDREVKRRDKIAKREAERQARLRRRTII